MTQAIDPAASAGPGTGAAKGGRLAGRIALITGASRGIGRAVALRFAEEGAHIIATARTQGALEDLDDEIARRGGKASLLPLNLNAAGKIDALGPTLYQRFGHIDVFVGNAAMLGTLSPLTHLPDKEWLPVFDINLHANWRLLRTLDPLLRKSQAGRAIFVTAAIARQPKAYWGAYAVSKAALEAMVKIYAQEVATTPVRANLIDPGRVRTALRAQAFPGEKPDELAPPESITGVFVDLAVPECEMNGEIVRLGPE